MVFRIFLPPVNWNDQWYRGGLCLRYGPERRSGKLTGLIPGVGFGPLMHACRALDLLASGPGSPCIRLSSTRRGAGHFSLPFLANPSDESSCAKQAPKRKTLRSGCCPILASVFFYPGTRLPHVPSLKPLPLANPA